MIKQVFNSLIYYINVKSPNLDLKQGISYLEREVEGGGGRDRQIEREIDRKSKT